MNKIDNSHVDEITASAARHLHNDHMSCLGIANTMSLAHAYNRRRFGRQDDWRRAMYRDHLADLLKENGPQVTRPIEIIDGWALDTSMSLPHLDRVLADADEIVAERSGQRRSADGTYRSYFQDVWTPEDLERYPSFLDFATSNEILSVVSRYLQCIPVLTSTLPSGIRFVESNALFDDQPDCPHDSQLYHIDYYSWPNVYVLVLLKDTTPEHGPWTFIPRTASQVARERLNYWNEGRPYRLSDDEIYSVVDRREVIEFAYPRGTVLFIESSGCFHFGSRNAVKPRFQLMYGYSGVCRTDFSELIMTAKEYPIHPGDSLLRRMLLDKHLLPVG
jgi:hypothetical protein